MEFIIFISISLGIVVGYLLFTRRKLNVFIKSQLEVNQKIFQAILISNEYNKTVGEYITELDSAIKKLALAASETPKRPN